MKRMIVTSMLAVAFISGGMIYANENDNNPPVNTVERTDVTFYETSIGASFSIKDSYGTTLYTENIKKDGVFSKSFDLSNLEEDNYYFEIENNNSITTVPFMIGNETVTINREMKTMVVKPQIDVEGNVVTLSRDVADTDSSLKIDIYHEGDDLIYTEEISPDGKLQRKYDFSKSPVGEYMFNITYNDKTFKEYVNM